MTPNTGNKLVIATTESGEYRVLLKAGKEKHIHDMFNREYLYFQAVDSFRKKSSDADHRFDELEGATKVFKPKSIRIASLPDGQMKELNFKSAEFVERAVNPNSLICSMAMIPSQLGEITVVPEPIKKFGSHALLILDIIQFFQSLDTSLESASLEFSRRSVNYFDRSIDHHELKLFDKQSKYSGQLEYRIAVQSNKGGPIELPIPGLKNYSKVIRVDSNWMVKEEL